MHHLPQNNIGHRSRTGHSACQQFILLANSVPLPRYSCDSKCHWYIVCWLFFFWVLFHYHAIPVTASELFFYLWVLFHYHAIPVTASELLVLLMGSVPLPRYSCDSRCHWYMIMSCWFYIWFLFHYHAIPVTAGVTDIYDVSWLFYLWVLSITTLFLWQQVSLLYDVSRLFFFWVLFHYHAIPVTASVTVIWCELIVFLLGSVPLPRYSCDSSCHWYRLWADCFTYGFCSITTLFLW